MLYLPFSSIKHFCLRSSCFKDSFKDCTSHICRSFCFIIIVERSCSVWIDIYWKWNSNGIHYKYSTKNIPIPSEKHYKTTLINKVELLMKRMRWKAHLTDRNYIGNANRLFHIFKNRKCLPQHKELIDFENDLLELVKNVTFRKVYNNFHDQLNKDIKSIRKWNNVFIFAEKHEIYMKLAKKTTTNCLLRT